jgi:cell division protein ZapD
MRPSSHAMIYPFMIQRWKVMRDVETLAYEQPLNEHIRVCLRLEQLFAQISHSLRGDSPWDSHVCLAHLLDVVNIIDRPDLKSKLTQEVKRHASNLQRFHTDNQDIDNQKLAEISQQLQDLIGRLCQTSSKLGQTLRDDVFLNNVRQHLLSPGAACSFDIPSYYYWLHQTPEQRQTQLEQWLQELLLVRDVVDTLLQITRQSKPSALVTAEQGFYQAMLMPQSPCQMIRIVLPKSLAIIPEISAGRHRFSIRFYEPSITERPQICKRDITFELTCCII